MTYDFIINSKNHIGMNCLYANILDRFLVPKNICRTTVISWYLYQQSDQDVFFEGLIDKTYDNVNIDRKINGYVDYKYSLFLGDMMKQSYKIKLEDFPKSNLNVVNIWGPLFHPPREKLIFFCFNDINDFLIFKLKYPNQYWGENHFYIRREN